MESAEKPPLRLMTPTMSNRLGWELPSVDAKKNSRRAKNGRSFFYESVKLSSDHLVGLFFFAGLSSRADLKRRFF